MTASGSIDRAREAHLRSGTPEEPASLVVSIVSAADGARFIAVATSEQECLARVAAYVVEQTRYQLNSASACRVRELAASGDAAGAVAEYFRHAGERWESEWLVTTRLHEDSRSTAWSGVVPLPEPATARDGAAQTNKRR